MKKLIGIGIRIGMLRLNALAATHGMSMAVQMINRLEPFGAIGTRKQLFTRVFDTDMLLQM